MATVMGGAPGHRAPLLGADKGRGLGIGGAGDKAIVRRDPLFPIPDEFSTVGPS